MTTAVRKSLCSDTLLSEIFHYFQKIPDPRNSLNRQTIVFTDVLMSGLAVFGLKYPSLLKYDQGCQDYSKVSEEILAAGLAEAPYSVLVVSVLNSQLALSR